MAPDWLLTIVFSTNDAILLNRRSRIPVHEILTWGWLSNYSSIKFNDEILSLTLILSIFEIGQKPQNERDQLLYAILFSFMMGVKNSTNYPQIPKIP